MVEVRKYHLHPTDRIPNSPRPLLHYKDVLARVGRRGGRGATTTTTSPAPSHAQRCDPVEVWDLFQKHGWRVEWIFRYGPTQPSHYHSRAHECMAVLSGTATIRFGAADNTSSDDLTENTHGGAREDGGVEVEAEAGDVFVIPAGVAHKTYNTRPPGHAFKLLTPGTGRGIEAADARRALADEDVVELSGFTMMGAYCGGGWDFVEGGGHYEEVWAVPRPELDPVFGSLPQGLCGTWPGSID